MDKMSMRYLPSLLGGGGLKESNKTRSVYIFPLSVNAAVMYFEKYQDFL